jgi:transposase
LGYVEALLIVPDLTAVSHHPRKRAFNDPVSRLHLKAVLALQATHNFDGEVEKTVYYWFRRLMRRFLFRTIHDLALMLDRMCEQREVVPSAGIFDSQSVKAPGARERGYNAHKKISGRKRHISVDTDGRLLAVNLTPADIAHSTGAQLVFDALAKRWLWVKHLFGDAA